MPLNRLVYPTYVPFHRESRNADPGLATRSDTSCRRLRAHAQMETCLPSAAWVAFGPVVAGGTRSSLISYQQMFLLEKAVLAAKLSCFSMRLEASEFSWKLVARLKLRIQCVRGEVVGVRNQLWNDANSAQSSSAKQIHRIPLSGALCLERPDIHFDTFSTSRRP